MECSRANYFSLPVCPSELESRHQKWSYVVVGIAVTVTVTVWAQVQLSAVVDAKPLLVFVAVLVLTDPVTLLVVVDPPKPVEILYTESTALFKLAGFRTLLR